MRASCHPSCNGRRKSAIAQRYHTAEGQRSLFHRPVRRETLALSVEGELQRLGHLTRGIAVLPAICSWEAAVSEVYEDVLAVSTVCCVSPQVFAVAAVVRDE